MSGVSGGTSPSPNALGALQWKCSLEQGAAPCQGCDTDQCGPGHSELSGQEKQAGTQQVQAPEMGWGFTDVRDIHHEHSAFLGCSMLCSLPVILALHP